MRLWSFHPHYLDAQGLVALWREALLAQKVLHGKTKGYRKHPQLNRFRACRRPEQAIASYLHAVCDEAERRGYAFDRKKICKQPARGKMPVTRGQIQYEFDWLCLKLKSRDSVRYRQLKTKKKIQTHPLFQVRPGPVESWERIPASRP